MGGLAVFSTMHWDMGFAAEAVDLLCPGTRGKPGSVLHRERSGARQQGPEHSKRMQTM